MWWMYFFHIPSFVHVVIMGVMGVVFILQPSWMFEVSERAEIMQNLACWHCVEVLLLFMVACMECTYNRACDRKPTWIPKEWVRLRVCWYYLPLFSPFQGNSWRMFDKDSDDKKKNKQYQASCKAFMVDIRTWFGEFGNAKDRKRWTTSSCCCICAGVQMVLLLVLVCLQYQSATVS